MQKRKKSFWWLALIAALIAVNFLSSVFHQRYDLTEEKRYSLSRPTKELLLGLKEPVRIEVFMKGEYPAGFRKLANSVQEFLQECKEYGKNNIQFDFTDPLKGLNDSEAHYFLDS